MRLMAASNTRARARYPLGPAAYYLQSTLSLIGSLDDSPTLLAAIHLYSSSASVGSLKLITDSVVWSKMRIILPLVGESSSRRPDTVIVSCARARSCSRSPLFVVRSLGAWLVCLVAPLSAPTSRAAQTSARLDSPLEGGAPWSGSFDSSRSRWLIVSFVARTSRLLLVASCAPLAIGRPLTNHTS